MNYIILTLMVMANNLYARVGELPTIINCPPVPANGGTMVSLYGFPSTTNGWTLSNGGYQSMVSSVLPTLAGSNLRCAYLKSAGIAAGDYYMPKPQGKTCVVTSTGFSCS